jgi:hypothetical protein
MSAGQAEVQVQSEFANGIALSNPVSLNIGSAPSITAPTISPSPLVRGGQATVTSTSIGAFNSDPVRNRVVIRTGGSEYPAQIDGIGLLGNVLAFTVPTDVPLGSATVQVIAAFGSQNITRVSGASMTIIDARKVTIVSGDRQTTDAGQPFAEPLAVRVTQADGSPVANAGVMFTAPAQGTSGFFENGGGTSTTVTTNSAGLATASVFKSNRSGGRFYVRASLTGQPNAAIFSLQIRNAVSNRQPRMPAHGAATAETAGIENSASIGYLNLTGFESPLAGISIFRLRDAAGNLVSEAAVPAAVPATSGLFFVDTRAGADTAVALVNPGSEEASITLRLRDSSGTPVGDPATIKLPSKAQTALFLSGVFGNNASNFLGTASLESTQPVGGVSLRAVVNNRGETIYSALPVAQAAAAGITGGELGFPHLAIGGGYRSVIILLNPGTARLTGKLRLHDNQGAALALPGGVQALDYSIPPGGHFLFDSASMAIDKAVSGYAVVAADSGNALPVGTLLFSGFSGNLLISEAAVPASRHLRRALLFVDQQSTELRNAAETLITGVAIANRGSNSAKVRFILRNMLGSVVGIPRTIEIPARGQTARFVHELMGSAAFEMQGSLEVVSDQSIELLTLRGTYNAQGEFLFTTLPVADYAAESKGALLFAHFADGGGYSTQTVVLNPSDAAGQITLRYLSSTGTPRLVDVK